jgi:hypothetical protein
MVNYEHFLFIYFGIFHICQISNQTYLICISFIIRKMNCINDYVNTENFILTILLLGQSALALLSVL